MLVPMPSDDGSARPDLGGTLLSESVFHVDPSQMDDDQVFVHRLVGLDPEVFQPCLGLQRKAEPVGGGGIHGAQCETSRLLVTTCA